MGGDVTTTYSEQDTTLYSIEETFGETIHLEEFAEMSVEERIAYFERLFAEADLSDTEQKDFETALDDEIDAFHLELYGYRAELDAILSSGNITPAEEANIEQLMQEIDEWLVMCSSSEDLVDNFNDAIGVYNEKNIEVAAGDSYTVSADDAQNGDVYTIDATATVNEDIDDGSVFDADNTEGLVDINGDGVLEAHEYYDQDGDGLADDDFNNDGVIDEKDDPFYVPVSSSTVTIELEDGDSLYLSSYEDSEPPVATFKVTKEDGTVYYIKILGEPKIVTEVLPTNLDAMPEGVTSRLFEGADKTHPVSFYQTGYDPALEGDFYTVYNMKDENNEKSIEPSPTDFEQGRNYIFNCEDDIGDDIDLNFDNDVELDFAKGDNNALIITATNSLGQSVTITINNWKSGNTGPTASEEWLASLDSINIDGGIITEDDYADLNFTFSDDNNGAAWQSQVAANMIYHDDNEDSIYTQATEDGVIWSSLPRDN